MPENVEEREDRIIIVKPVSLVLAGLWTMVWLGAVSMCLVGLLQHDPMRQHRSDAWKEWVYTGAALIVVTAVWYTVLAGMRIVTEFVPNEQSVYRRNFFSFCRIIPFGDILDISPMESEGDPPYIYYRLVLRSGRYGAGLRLTESWPSHSPHAGNFALTVLPKLRAFLEPDQGKEDAAKGILPEETSFYSRSGDRFSANRRLTLLTGWLVCAGCFLGFLHVLPKPYFGDYFLQLMFGGLLAFFYLALLCRVYLDGEKKEMLIVRFFGLRRVWIPFERFLGVGTEREYVNFLYYGTSMYALYTDQKGREKRYPFKRAFFTKHLAAAGTETENIITAYQVRTAQRNAAALEEIFPEDTAEGA